MLKRLRSYGEWQLEKLTKPRVAANYLNAALADSPEMFLKALRKVAQAHQMSRVAKEAGVQRETLYRSLSEQGNPTLATLQSILSAVELGITIHPIGEEPVSPSNPGPHAVVSQSASPSIGRATDQLSGCGFYAMVSWSALADTITGNIRTGSIRETIQPVETLLPALVARGVTTGERNYA